MTRNEKHAQLQPLKTSTICYPKTLPSSVNLRLICGLCFRKAPNSRNLYVHVYISLALNMLLFSSRLVFYVTYACFRDDGWTVLWVRCDSWNTLWFIKDILLALRGNKIPNQICRRSGLPSQPTTARPHQHRGWKSQDGRGRPLHTIPFPMVRCSIECCCSARESRWCLVMFYVTFVVASLSQWPLAAENQRPASLRVTQGRVFNLMRQIVFKVNATRRSDRWL